MASEVHAASALGPQLNVHTHRGGASVLSICRSEAIFRARVMIVSTLSRGSYRESIILKLVLKRNRGRLHRAWIAVINCSHRCQELTSNALGSIGLGPKDGYFHHVGLQRLSLYSHGDDRLEPP